MCSLTLAEFAICCTACMSSIFSVHMHRFKSLLFCRPPPALIGCMLHSGHAAQLLTSSTDSCTDGLVIAADIARDVRSRKFVCHYIPDA